MKCHNNKIINSVKSAKSFFFTKKLLFHNIISKKTFFANENSWINNSRTLSNSSIGKLVYDSKFISLTKRSFSTFNSTKTDHIERNITFNKTNQENPALVKILKNNEDRLNILIMKLNEEDELKDHLCYNEALSLCKYCENSDFSNKSRKTLLDLFRNKDYSFLSKLKPEDNDLYIDYFTILFNLDLEDIDLKAIENKYFQIKDNLKIKHTIKIYEAFYYYEYFGFKFDKMKKDILNILIKNYLTMSDENIYILNSSILFAEPKEIALFSLFAAEKLFHYTDPEFIRITNLSLTINCIQPLPKIISEINNSSTIPEKIKQKVLLNSTEILNRFFKYLPKEEIDESLLISLSNSFFYGSLNPAIFDLFIDSFYQNLASFPHENIIELFFLLLMSTKKNEIIYKNKERLMNQILEILENTHREPVIYLNNHKFFIYLNNCRTNLNKVFTNWVANKDKNLKNMTEKEIDLYEKYLKILNLSIDFYPFATKDESYSEDLLEELFLVFKNIFERK